jgi:hypothetical protein
VGSSRDRHYPKPRDADIYANADRAFTCKSRNDNKFLQSHQDCSGRGGLERRRIVSKPCRCAAQLCHQNAVHLLGKRKQTLCKRNSQTFSTTHAASCSISPILGHCVSSQTVWRLSSDSEYPLLGRTMNPSLRERRNGNGKLHMQKTKCDTKKRDTNAYLERVREHGTKKGVHVASPPRPAQTMKHETTCCDRTHLWPHQAIIFLLGHGKINMPFPSILASTLTM